MPTENTREKARQHIDKKLQTRLRMYFGISIILIGVVIYEILSGAVAFPLASVGLIVGILLGIMTARMFHISWNHDAEQIVSKLDIFGGVILALYIVFAIFRATIIGYFIDGAAVAGVSISITAGLMIGRAFGTRGKIIQVLKEQKVFN